MIINSKGKKCIISILPIPRNEGKNGNHLETRKSFQFQDRREEIGIEKGEREETGKEKRQLVLQLLDLFHSISLQHPTAFPSFAKGLFDFLWLVSYSGGDVEVVDDFGYFIRIMLSP
jgi:hypothetical protein